ncbi:MAG TPA: hypothetical protein VKU00_04795 [Chthonomonadaceae bacterium]|nr:hypothetical protein [Chthonomonadaceae bacterium]
MPNAVPEPEKGMPVTSLAYLYALAVLLDVGLIWYRTLLHFTPPQLVFRLFETALKLAVMLLVLSSRRWACYVQLILSGLALVSGALLPFQSNHRAANDPLLWVSLAAQILAGGYCVYRLTAGSRP